MSDVETEWYNEEEADNFAIALAQKVKLEFLNNGYTEAESQNHGQKKYEEVRRRHALEFLRKMEEKLDSLSNQTIAQLLRILIALGLDIEDEEELEYWINKLTHEALDRIALYFNQRDNISLWRQLTTPPKTQKVLYNLKNYSNKEIEALSVIIKSLKKLNNKVSKSRENRDYRKDILDKISKVLEKDLKLKREQQRKQNQSRSKPREKPQQNNKTEDSFAILTGKMTTEGVEVGGRYWNEVVSDFNRSEDKNNFARNWQIDNNLRNDLDYRLENDRKQEEENNRRQEQENQQQENLLRQQEQENQQQENLRHQQEMQEERIIQQIQEQENRRLKNDERQRQVEKILEKRGVKEDKSENKSNQNNENSHQQNSSNSPKSNSGGSSR